MDQVVVTPPSIHLLDVFAIMWSGFYRENMQTGPYMEIELPPYEHNTFQKQNDIFRHRSVKSSLFKFC